jgi:hypothetical protein
MAFLVHFNLRQKAPPQNIPLELTQFTTVVTTSRRTAEGLATPNCPVWGGGGEA